MAAWIAPAMEFVLAGLGGFRGFVVELSPCQSYSGLPVPKNCKELKSSSFAA
jgi:hypothetical protein